MNQRVPPENNPPSKPEPGIQQHAENLTMGTGMQAAQGNDNVQVQGDKNIVFNVHVDKSAVFPTKRFPSFTRRRCLQLAALTTVGVSVPLVEHLFKLFKDMSKFQFDVVTIDANGQEIRRIQKKAEYFIEDFGNGVTLEMVAIPGGTFKMGSSLTEKGCSNNECECPQHQVTLQPFFMSKFQVTQRQWRAIASLTQYKCKRDLKPQPSCVKGYNLPVEQVSWHDAVEFCARLSKITGQEYRLPSEAEWEYACRARTTTPFHFGETITTDYANYGRTNWEYGPVSCSDVPPGNFINGTTPVGHFLPNAFGLYDMHGNVWEWCGDAWHNNYCESPTDGTVWLTGGDNNRSPLRGGSWGDSPENCRCASRNNNDYRNNKDVAIGHDYLDPYIGFRPVCVVSRTSL